MAYLSLCLLGPFQVTLDGEAVTGFASDKVRALLAYLAVEADRPHRRDTLVGLLWPEWPDQAARNSLRNALANLRGVIGDRYAAPPFLRITRETIQFNTDSDAEMDVNAFTELLEAESSPQQAMGPLEEAIGLYQGDILEGFHVKDSAPFEDWCSLMRERLHRQALTALHQVAGYYEGRREYEQACAYAWRQVELDPWQEEAQGQLMRVLALRGQRSVALAQYETCRRLLDEELGVEPGEETTRLYEQIRDGTLKPPVSSGIPVLTARPPSFLTEEEPSEVERPVFVARDHELGQLDGFLDRALEGQGRVVFITGEAGSGKTALVHEFTRLAQDAHADLVIARGNGNAHTGIGDPYLPFREVLGLLSGDVEARWAVGVLTTDHARRLWNTLPLTAQALVEDGPDLVDTFVPGIPLVERAMAYASGGADWLARLDELVRRKATIPGGPGPQQSALFEQYVRVVQNLACQRPLVLVLDDLQWADPGSVSLLFHLGRQVMGSRILILGAYRPEEVTLGRDGERHPLESVVHEFQREFGDIAVNVDQAASRDFVEAFLDSEPNRLGPQFRERLYAQTRGHPLFAVELLRGLQERGDLVQDEQGRWIEGPALDWETLPPRIEGVIAERIGRLSDPLQEALRAASVEGETFTAEVVARVQEAKEGEMVARFSDELDRRHRLVSAQGVLRTGDQRLSQYRFRHILFQKYLYDSLDSVKRTRLHEEVGTALEALYGEGAQEIAVELARHFQEAGMTEKAIPHLKQAGEKAVRLSANQEAIAHFTRALELLVTQPDTPERTQQELALQLGLAVPLLVTRGVAAPEVARAYARARELCQQVGETPQLFPTLWSLSQFYGWRAEFHTAMELGEQMLRLAERTGDPLLEALAHSSLGRDLHFLGEFAPARAHLEHMIAFYDPQQHHALAFVYGQDPGVHNLAWSSWTLWFLGYPDQALKRAEETIALARELDHPFSLAYALCFAGMIHLYFLREFEATQEYVEPLLQLTAKEGFAFQEAIGIAMQGSVQFEAGEVEEGIAQIIRGIDGIEATGVRAYGPMRLAVLAEVHGKAGQAQHGLSAIGEGLALVEETDERLYEAESHRLKGELLLMQDDEPEAEGSFHKAIEVARRQQAKSWELRAAMSMARLWHSQARREEAHKLLAEIYAWFTEGFDTPDLKDAKALLEALS